MHIAQAHALYNVSIQFVSFRNTRIIVFFEAINEVCLSIRAMLSSFALPINVQNNTWRTQNMCMQTLSMCVSVCMCDTRLKRKFLQDVKYNFCFAATEISVESELNAAVAALSDVNAEQYPQYEDEPRTDSKRIPLIHNYY